MRILFSLLFCKFSIFFDGCRGLRFFYLALIYRAYEFFPEKQEEKIAVDEGLIEIIPM